MGASAVLALVGGLAVGPAHGFAIPVGGEFHVNSHTTDYQIVPEVCGNDDGTFVVTWSSAYQDGYGFGVFGQRFDSDGSALGTEFQVNSTSPGYQFQPDSCCTNNGFVVVWSNQSDGDGGGIFGRRFDGTGNVTDVSLGSRPLTMNSTAGSGTSRMTTTSYPYRSTSPGGVIWTACGGQFPSVSPAAHESVTGTDGSTPPPLGESDSGAPGSSWVRIDTPFNSTLSVVRPRKRYSPAGNSCRKSSSGYPLQGGSVAQFRLRRLLPGIHRYLPPHVSTVRGFSCGGGSRTSTAPMPGLFVASLHRRRDGRGAPLRSIERMSSGRRFAWPP